ncbi:MAG: hypothetical protein IKS63_01030 [Firmicutes bacterium]|nr:hypothetical protein [Bacillota bacterium]
MKKRIFSIALALIMVFAVAAVMTGCGDDSDPVATYNKASENMQAAKDIQMTGDMSVKMEAEGQSMEITADMDMTMIKSETDDPADLQLYLDLSAQMMGQDVKTKMWVKDKTSYTLDSDGNKTKADFGKDAGENIDQLFSTEQKIDDYVKDSKQDGDTVTLTLDSKKYITDMIAKLGSIGQDAENIDLDQIKKTLDSIDIDDMTITATIKDENFTAIKTSIPMEIDMSAFTSLTSGGTTDGGSETGQKITVNIDLNFDPVKVDSGATIDFPDFSDYK